MAMLLFYIKSKPNFFFFEASQNKYVLKGWIPFNKRLKSLVDFCYLKCDERVLLILKFFISY